MTYAIPSRPDETAAFCVTPRNWSNVLHVWQFASVAVSRGTLSRAMKRHRSFKVLPASSAFVNKCSPSLCDPNSVPNRQRPQNPTAMIEPASNSFENSRN